MKKIIKNKKKLIWGIIGGMLLIVGGFMYDVIFAGIPYQDPTAQMTQKYNFHQTVAETIKLTGLVILLISFIGIIVTKFMKLNKNV